MKITASYAGDDTHHAASASYWLTITSDAPEDHCITDREAVAPTCEDDGYTAGSICTVCSRVFSGIEPIPATGHDYQYTAHDNVITGTCSHDDTHVITATIHAPGSADGEATVTYSAKWPADARDLVIGYTADGGNKTASVTYNGETASVTYSVPVEPDDSSGGSNDDSDDDSDDDSSASVNKNPDGSTTTTTTNQTTGTVTEVTKDKDGTTTTVETKKDGTVTETVKTPDGTTGTVVADKNGNVTEAKATVTGAAVMAAEKSGETVTLPVEVPSAKTTEDAPAVQATVPKTAGSVKVEIPVEKVTPGTVAVIVNEDGSEKIVATSVTTENGVVLTLDASATVKVIDNAKSFTDVPETNVFYNEVSALSAREVMVGRTETQFDLYSNVTLNQAANVAGRITGAVDVSDFEGGIAWGAENGLSTGNEAATRGDVLKALYVAAGSPAVEDTSILTRFKDASGILEDMVVIAAWAAQNGILKGDTSGNANLSANVTHGQACALAGRTMNALA